MDQLRVWLTDGSPAPFTDIERLEATHPGPGGAPIPYKGCIDDAVYVGVADIRAGRGDDVLVPEAEWCILLPEPTDPDRMGPETPIVVQGLIEGKWLNRFAGGFLWKPASLGNNLLAAGPGVRTTFAAIEGGSPEDEAAAVIRYAGGHELRARLADLRGQNILELVRAALRRGPVAAVDCAAIGPRAALVNEPRFLQLALQRTELRPSDLTAVPAWQRVVEAMASAIIEEGHGAPPGSPVQLTVTDGRGREVGSGSLVWR